jgi:hypothetical protein
VKFIKPCLSLFTILTLTGCGGGTEDAIEDFKSNLHKNLKNKKSQRQKRKNLYQHPKNSPKQIQNLS